jgi:chemotaxis protein methyltransferase CheR
VSSTLTQVAELLRREAGFALPAERTQALRAAMERAAPGLGPAAVLHAAADPKTGPGLVDRLIDEVTVQESSFLRDAGQFEVISWHRLRESATGKIRVWSAGCAAGEEAYTLALLAAEAFGAQATPVDVLGTDICRTALAAAATGRYRERAVRALSASVRRRYLVHQPDGTSVVGDRLRGLVRFQRHNLARDPIPPPGEAAFDLIVCRNVLIYLTVPAVKRLSRLLEAALRPGGMLVLGAADVLCRTAAYGTPPGGSEARTPALGTAGEAEPRHPRPAHAQSTHPRQPSSSRPPGAGHPSRPRQHPRPGPRPGAGLPSDHGHPPDHGHPSDHGHSSDHGHPTDRGQPPDAGHPASERDRQLRQVLDAAGRGDRDRALEQVTLLVTADPLDADFHFLHGLLALEADEPAQARDALRRALCADPAFGLAAFTLGRAYDALGDGRSARRSYQQALHTLDPGNGRHEELLQQIDVGDIAAACRARLEGHQ